MQIYTLFFLRISKKSSTFALKMEYSEMEETAISAALDSCNRYVAWIVLLFLTYWLPVVIVKIITKIRTDWSTDGYMLSGPYCPGPYNNDGERFESRSLNRKCCLTIDDEGIRGTYREFRTKRFSLKPELKELNVRWADILSVKFERRYYGLRRVSDGLAIYDDPKSADPTEAISLAGIPTGKLVDCINYFYFRYAKRQSLEIKPLIRPVGFEYNRLFRWFLTLLTAVYCFYQLQDILM